MNRTFGVKAPRASRPDAKTRIGKVKGLRKCPECGELYIGDPELKKNEESGVSWTVYTHPSKQCRKFHGRPPMPKPPEVKP